MDQAGDTVENIDRTRNAAADDVLQGSDPALPLTVVDNLHGMPISDEEIAAVEAFLGLQAATIFGEDKSKRSKAI